jgi:hypothetical protein
MNVRVIYAILIILLVVPVIGAAATVEVVTNGNFPSSVTGWTIAKDSAFAETTATVSGGECNLRVKSGSRTGNWVSISQDVDLSKVDTLSFKYRTSYNDGYKGDFSCLVGGVEKFTIKNSNMGTTYTTKTIDVSDITGTKTISFKYLVGIYADYTVMVDSVSALATVSSPALTGVSATPNSGNPTFDSTLSASITPGYPTSTTYAWSISPSTGWSYKSGYSSSSPSPKISISSVNNYSVSCEVSNGYGTSGGHSTTITATEAIYNVSVNLFNETANYFLESTDISLTSGDTILKQDTTTTGTHTFNGITDGTYGVMAEVDGYESKLQYKQVDGADIVVNFTMVATGGGAGGSGASYAPHYVQVSVKDGYIPLANVDVTAVMMESSGPLDWLTSWIGLSKDIEITGTTLHGSTDSNGVISFQMIESLKYKITISKDGYDTQTAYIYPTDNQYYFNLGGKKSIVATGDKDPNAMVLTGLNTTIISDTQVNFIITYNDTQKQTTFCNLSILDQARNQIAFKSYYGNNDLSHTVIINDYAGESYFIRIEAKHATFGDIIREYTRTYPDLMTFGLPADLLMYLAFIIIVFTGLLVSMGNVGVGSVIVCFEGWLFYFIGWLNDLGYVVLMPLILFTIMVVIYNFKAHEREEGY